MKKTPLKPIVYWILSVLWLGVIFLFSARTASDYHNSASFLFNINLPQWLTFAVWESGHFLEYLVLGFFMLSAVSSTFKLKKPMQIIIVMAICILYALSDEIHQLYVPGRTFQALDLILDTLGSASGTAIAIFIQKRKKNQP
jgi:VanZ family protein